MKPAKNNPPSAWKNWVCSN